MNPAYQRVVAANDVDRRDLFVTAANRIGTTVQNIEKDFWVCWTLDALFHHLRAGGPRLLFKGGTSLSKAYGLISRFSEDIDVTIFPSDIGEEASVEVLGRLSGKKRGQRLDAIKTACQGYVDGELRAELDAIAKDLMEATGKDPAELRVVLDQEDPDKQSLLIHYPSAVEKSDYVAPSIKIESGAKSALDPHESRVIVPYLAPDFPDGDALAVTGVKTIAPERTFLDKVLILHGMTCYFKVAGRLRGRGRVSRHYYDVHKLMAASVGERACTDDSLIEDCVQHARIFFYRANAGLESAQRGSFQLCPTGEMIDPLLTDYRAMATMILGEVPVFETVLESVARAERRLNSLDPSV
jgi:hypothetical protein